MANGFGESGQIEVWIVLVLNIVMGHIGMSKAVNSDIMSQTNLLANLTMRLAGAAADTATKGEVGRTADVLVLAANGIIFLFDNSLG